MIHTGRVAPPQPKVGGERALGQRGGQLPMAGLQPLPGVADPHSLLMAVLVEQRPRVHVEGVATLAGGELACGPCMELAQFGRSALGKDAEESGQGGLARNSLDAEHLGHSGVGGEPRHPRELVGTADDAAEESEGGVGGGEGVRAGGAMGQEVGQGLTETVVLGESWYYPNTLVLTFALESGHASWRPQAQLPSLNLAR